MEKMHKMIKKETTHRFWKRIKFKYRFSAMNESTLEEVWKIRTSIFSGIVFFLVISAMLVFVTSFIIIATPFRYFLPGYLDSEVRNNAVSSALLADSLGYKIRAQDYYLYNLRKILDGSMQTDSIYDLPDTIHVSESNKALQKSEAEKLFTQRYEEDEKYNLSVLPTSSASENFVLYIPVNGVVTEKFDASQNRFGIVVQANKKETVLSVLEGTVIFASYDLTDGYVIQVQHKVGLISIYKHCSSLLKKVGDRVPKGGAIALLEALTQKEKLQSASLAFELWYNGSAVNPEDYITF